jgi:cobalt-zinc-cadmium efflux system membrane fusion protein
MILRLRARIFVISRSCFRLGLAAAIALALAACGKEGAKLAPASKSTAKSSTGPVAVPPAQKQFLTIEAVSASDAVDVLSLPGRVTFQPQAQSAIGATTAGRVSQLLIRAGEVVKAGAPLLTIESADAASARATLDQAITRLATAENVYRRNVEMVEKGVGLELERQEAEARLKDARAEHDRARQSVALVGGGHGSQVTVRAPADGVVMSIRVTIGATVAPGGEALLELGDPTRLQVVAQVPERDLRHVAIGQEAEVELPALAARIAAKVENFSPRVEPESRRAQVYLALAKPVTGLRAGMMAQITLRVSAEAGVTIPVSAVLIKDGKRRVVYVERPDGTFEARDVDTGRNQDGRVLILKGLVPGEKVVVRGALLLDNQAEQLL